MELAALATRAVPGLSPTGVADAADDARDFMSAVVVDAEGHRWRVRGPRHAQAAMRLETEVHVLRGFSTGIRAELPFRVPSVAGATRVEEMRIFVYNHLPGAALNLDQLITAPAELRTDYGRMIAAIHDLDTAVVDHADLPRYSAERLRQLRLNELDAAAVTGKVPAILLRRWENAMEDKSLWNFTPSVTHGDLHEDNVLIEGSRVVAVTGWTDMHIGDPAADLSWLIASPEPSFADAVVEAYRQHRRAEVDQHLMRRAALHAEFALAQWLIRGTSSENEQMIDEAQALLRTLATDIENYGGRKLTDAQPESTQHTPPQASSVTQDSAPVTRPGAAATIAGAATWDDDDEPAVITDADLDSDPASSTAEPERGFGNEHAAPGDEGDSDALTQPRATERTSPETRTDTAEQDVLDQSASGQGTSEHNSASQGAPREGVSGPDFSEQDLLGQGAAHMPDRVGDAAEAEDTGEADTEALGHRDDIAAAMVSDIVADNSTGRLPIQPTERAEERARRRHFFPHSAPSASSPEEESEPSAGEREQPAQRNPPRSADKTQAETATISGSSTRETVYSRHPGLRPPSS